MPYLYMLQPVEYINTNCFKIGLSSTFDLNRLKSYGTGTRYIQYFECINYREAETELINNLNNEETITLFKGREYFCGNKKTILNIFIQVMLKYTGMEEMDDIKQVKEVEQVNKNNENKSEDIIEKMSFTDILHKQIEYMNSKERFKDQYSCRFCNFNCEYESNYDSHLNSKKHKDNIKSKNLCDGCREEFPTKYNKYWHEKSCEIIQILNRRIFKRIVREQNLIDNTKI